MKYTLPTTQALPSVHTYVYSTQLNNKISHSIRKKNSKILAFLLSIPQLSTSYLPSPPHSCQPDRTDRQIDK